MGTTKRTTGTVSLSVLLYTVSSKPYPRFYGAMLQLYIKYAMKIDGKKIRANGANDAGMKQTQSLSE